jgi:hypothetical protein
MYVPVPKKARPYASGPKWTAEEDAQLLRLIENGNMTWKQISDELGRSESGCRGRYTKRLSRRPLDDSIKMKVLQLYTRYAL